jgi:hypothetical protein
MNVHYAVSASGRQTSPSDPDTEATDAIGETTRGAWLSKFPLVSVVIINWNYSRYVGAAIASVKRQSYPHFECLVVDNGSNDDSIDVMTRAIGDDPRFRVVQLPRNFGHIGAALKVLDQLNGQFVNFLDADDILFESFLASHVQVHLVSSAPVSFTSSDVITIDANDEMIAGRIHAMHEEQRQSLDRCLPKFRDPALPTVSDADYETLRDATFDAPSDLRSWCWSPGSSNVIRRDLLSTLTIDSVDEPIYGGVDGFFLLPLFAITGANLIGTPLSAYRVHGDNDHARLPQLRGVRNGNEAAYLRNSAAKRLALLTLIDRSERLLEIVHPPHQYFQVIGILGKNCHDSIFLKKSVFAAPEMKRAVARQYAFLVKVFGERRVMRELRGIMKMIVVAEIVCLAYNYRVPLATIRRFLLVGLFKSRRTRRTPYAAAPPPYQEFASAGDPNGRRGRTFVTSTGVRRSWPLS